VSPLASGRSQRRPLNRASARIISCPEVRTHDIDHWTCRVRGVAVAARGEHAVPVRIGRMPPDDPPGPWSQPVRDPDQSSPLSRRLAFATPTVLLQLLCSCQPADQIQHGRRDGARTSAKSHPSAITFRLLNDQPIQDWACSTMLAYAHDATEP
jgi:hypothetical protein